MRSALELYPNLPCVGWIGFPWSQGLVTRTLASAGGTLAATREALTTGLGCTLAGGTHHAYAAEGSGFCVFNDIAIAIRGLPAETRVAVIDPDVHQGDGTAHIFAGEPAFSLSRSTTAITSRFVSSKAPSMFLSKTVATMSITIGHSIPSCLKSSDSNLIFYSIRVGVDGLREDKLSKLNLTMVGLASRDEKIFALAAQLVRRPDGSNNGRRLRRPD